MFRGLQKLMHFLLALAVLLAPLEFAVAHDMAPMTAGGKMAMQQLDQQDPVHHEMVDGADQHQQCGDGHGLCKHCVYCSPALSFSIEIAIDKPVSVQAQTIFVSHYSIDLPVEFRPPRQL